MTLNARDSGTVFNFGLTTKKQDQKSFVTEALTTAVTLSVAINNFFQVNGYAKERLEFAGHVGRRKF